MRGGMSGTPSIGDDDGQGGLKRRAAIGAAMAGGLALSGLSTPARAAAGVRTLTSRSQLRAAYDHVIVGAGSAGCVLAHRLGRAGRRVLVIEAGLRATLPAVATPPAWPSLQESALDWRYVTTPQPGLGGRAITCPRGKAVGGSSIINALAYQRGHAAAYDRWPAGWRHADLLPYFRRAETFSGGASDWRGGNGPLHVLSLADVTDRTPVAEPSWRRRSKRASRRRPTSAGNTRPASAGTSSASKVMRATMPRRPTWTVSRTVLERQRSICWPACRCSASRSSAADALACVCPAASCGPRATCCSAPGRSTRRAC